MNDTNLIRTIRCGLLWAGALLGAQAADAATVCVNPAGGGCQPTIEEGIETATPGDTVSLAPGVYYVEGIVIDKPLTLKGSAKAIIDAGKIPDPADTAPPIALIHGSKHALFIAANDVTIEGITIRNSRFNAIQMNNGVTGATINKVYIYNVGAYCINGGSGNNGVTVAGSTLQSCFYSGINLVGNNATAVKNRIKNIGLRGVFVTGNGATAMQNQIVTVDNDAIRVDGNNALIKKNTVNNSTSNAIRVIGDDPVVTENAVTGVNNVGVDVSCPNACSSARITKNKIAHSGLGGYEAIYASPYAPGLLIEGNTVTGSSQAGVLVAGGGNNITTINNNKIANTGRNDTDQPCIYVEYAAHVVSANQVSECGSAGIEAYGDGTQIIGNTVKQAGAAGIIADANNVQVTNNKVGNAAGFGVMTGVGKTGIAIIGNQLKDNRDAICDAAANTDIGGNSGNGAVWDAGATFGTKGVDSCGFIFNAN